MHARRLRNHWNYDGYFPFSFKFGSTACYFSVRGASFCVLGMGILSTKPHLGHFGQQISLHHFRYFTYLPLDARSILHVFQGTQGIWWGGLGEGGGGGDNVRWNFHTYSILHVFQGTQGIWWGGLGGGVGEVITFVGTFTHIFHTTCFPRHAEPHCVDLNRVDLSQTRNVCLLTRLAQDLASHKRSAC